jgi:hypothetical protein
MAFNAQDNWEFPAAVVVAAEDAFKIGPNHAAPAEANPGAILQAAVFQREIRAPGALLQPPGVAATAAAAASQLLKKTRKYQGLGKLVCLLSLTAVRMGGFSSGEPIPSAVKLIIGMACDPDASSCWP